MSGETFLEESLEPHYRTFLDKTASDFFGTHGGIDKERKVRRTLVDPRRIGHITVETDEADTVSRWNSLFALADFRMTYGVEEVMTPGLMLADANWVILPRYQQIMPDLKVQQVLIDGKTHATIVSHMCPYTMAPLYAVAPSSLNFYATRDDGPVAVNDLRGKGLGSGFFVHSCFTGLTRDLLPLNYNQSQHMSFVISSVMGHTLCARMTEDSLLYQQSEWSSRVH